MFQFSLPACLKGYETFAEFAKEEQLQQTDLLITNRCFAGNGIRIQIFRYAIGYPIIENNSISLFYSLHAAT